MTNDKPPFLNHLIELRQRLIRSVVAILLCFAGLAYFANDLYTLVSTPLLDVLPEGSNMIATDVAAPFFAPFKLAFMLSIVIAFPYLLHQVWGFIAPGLYNHEKKFAAPILITSVLLFYFGIAFSYFIVFPLVFSFFTSVAPENIVIATDISSYLDFVLKLFIAFGLSFEVPVVVFILCLSGVTTVDNLKLKRPYVILGAFVLGMLLTPPDVISQTLLAIPMWMLFELGLVLSRAIKVKQPNEEITDN
ncbi:MAG: sec-independent protein translocase protein TatC [Psychrosphaera sp.]|jgi:sec-independent protein translocase protein TatC|uniref:Sec-independent protein translocase protein TatC n=1 Tax=Psychrosphaera aquimarina TaxID=2044854 RepID=A0ABU3QY35_9GAMM|nr:MULTISPECIES: twin-arginine translocase subunit TatC [Psychrosphaera]MBU2919671.1 twin-arginine translocase subunit TatC [Psychrosphaera sp. F3M07]MDU0112184.1 twin-arginine translocase subunit TatC [Psychrosphaera aquimarina]